MRRSIGDAVKGPRIIKVIHKKFGACRNLTALYITALVIPVFWLVRMAQLILYPNLLYGWFTSLLTMRRIGSAFRAKNLVGSWGMILFGAFTVIG